MVTTWKLDYIKPKKATQPTQKNREKNCSGFQRKIHQQETSSSSQLLVAVGFLGKDRQQNFVESPKENSKKSS